MPRLYLQLPDSVPRCCWSSWQLRSSKDPKSPIPQNVRHSGARTANRKKIGSKPPRNVPSVSSSPVVVFPETVATADICWQLRLFSKARFAFIPCDAYQLLAAPLTSFFSARLGHLTAPTSSQVNPPLRNEVGCGGGQRQWPTTERSAWMQICRAHCNGKRGDEWCKPFWKRCNSNLRCLSHRCGAKNSTLTCRSTSGFWDEKPWFCRKLKAAPLMPAAFTWGGKRQKNSCFALPSC